MTTQKELSDDQKKVVVRFIMRLQEMVDSPEPFKIRDKVRAFIAELESFL